MSQVGLNVADLSSDISERQTKSAVADLHIMNWPSPTKRQTVAAIMNDLRDRVRVPVKITEPENAHPHGSSVFDTTEPAAVIFAGTLNAGFTIASNGLSPCREACLRNSVKLARLGEASP